MKMQHKGRSHELKCMNDKTFSILLSKRNKFLKQYYYNFQRDFFPLSITLLNRYILYIQISHSFFYCGFKFHMRVLFLNIIIISLF